MLLSGSRDKTLIIWNLTRDESQYGYPKRSLHGHSHIVSDCVRSFPLILCYCDYGQIGSQKEEVGDLGKKRNKEIGEIKAGKRKHDRMETDEWADLTDRIRCSIGHLL